MLGRDRLALGEGGDVVHCRRQQERGKVNFLDVAEGNRRGRRRRTVRRDDGQMRLQRRRSRGRGKLRRLDEKRQQRRRLQPRRDVINLQRLFPSILRLLELEHADRRVQHGNVEAVELVVCLLTERNDGGEGRKVELPDFDGRGGEGRLGDNTGLGGLTGGGSADGEDEAGGGETGEVDRGFELFSGGFVGVVPAGLKTSREREGRERVQWSARLGEGKRRGR